MTRDVAVRSWQPPPPEPSLEPSERLRARLAELGIDLHEEIGRGAMSVVYRATDHPHVRSVAVKVLQPPAGAEHQVERFEREIQLAAGLQHPHILPVYGSGAVEGRLFYVMPYAEEGSLRRRLTRIGRLSVEEAVRIAREVADALGYAHARGIVHRDIKPENILLEAGHAVVADFGVALVLSWAARRESEEEAREESRVTGPGMVVGTPAYMSPEQASGDAAVDGRSDIYGLGCVLYEMLTGERPFSGPTAQATIARRFQGAPVPLRLRRAEIPAAVAAAGEKALAVDPADRFPTAADFGAALAGERRGWLAELQATRLARRGLTLAAGALAVAAVALLAAHPPHRGATQLDSNRIVVAALSNETADTTLNPLGEMVASWITDRVSRVPAIEVVTSAIVMPAQHDQHQSQGDLDDPVRLHTLAVETRAGTVVSGSYYRSAPRVIEFHVEITDANTGRLLRAIGPIRSGGEAEQTAGALSSAVAAAIDTLIVQPMHHAGDRPSARRPPLIGWDAAGPRPGSHR